MRRMTALLLSLGLLLGLAACGKTAEAGGFEIYYAVREAEGYGQAAVQSETWRDAPEEVTPDDLLPRLLTPPEDDGLYVVFPHDVRLLSWTLEEGLLTADLSESYSELSGIALTLANYCLTLTASQLDGVERVAITVEGQPLPEGGEGPFAAADVLLSGELRDPVTVDFVLYYPRTDGDGLGTESREAQLYSDTAAARAEAVLGLLTAGGLRSEALRDPFAGLETLPPPEVRSRVCTLTLTEDWVAVLTEDEAAREALTESLCALEGIETVAFNG